MQPQVLLEGKKLSKRFGTHDVLNQLSLTVTAGERVALMGPSGAGKSTLLNCLGGIEIPDQGEVLFAGAPLSALDENGRARLRRGSIGTIFQFFHLLPTLTVAENIELPLQLLRWPKARREAAVQKLLAEVGLKHRAHGKPDELSGGEQQRTAIARALSPEPRLILADEPTGNLDSASGERILDLLQTLSESHGFSLVMVTHQPETTRICDRVLHLLDGTIVHSSDPSVK